MISPTVRCSIRCKVLVVVNNGRRYVAVYANGLLHMLTAAAARELAVKWHGEGDQRSCRALLDAASVCDESKPS